MPVDTDAEILRLRAGLRDLVALSTIPATWVGREPRDVAGGLADARTLAGHRQPLGLPLFRRTLTHLMPERPGVRLPEPRGFRD